MMLSCIGAYLIGVLYLGEVIRIPAAIPTSLGTAVAFFITFNNNQAYGRWWEARTIWGALVNDSRSWARNVLIYADAANDYDDVPRRMVRRHIAFLYALKQSLRGQTEREFDRYVSTEECRYVSKFANIPSALLDEQTRDLDYLRNVGRVDGFAFLTLNEMIVRFSDSMGRCERIRNTPFPGTYLYFTRLFIWFFVVLMTMVIADDTGIWSIFLGWIIGFVFHVTHINGLSLMNPFDMNPASMPLSAITRTIEINLLEILGETEVPKPVQPINNEYLL